MRVNFFGWYGRNNCGDEAFREVAYDLFPSANHELVFTADLPDPKADIVVLGGGDVIKPAYLDVLKGKEFYIWGAGLGYESEIELLRDHKVKGAIFRNESDAMLAGKNGMAASYCPDMAFGLYGRKEHPYRELPAPDKRKEALVIVTDNINESWQRRDTKMLAYGGYLKEELAESIYELHQWYNITMLPFSDAYYDHDLRCLWDIAGRMKERTHGFKIIKEAPDVNTALNLIDASDLVISMKYHGIIFSTLMGVPFVNIGISRKTQTFCAEQGLKELSIPDFSFTKDRFLAAVKEAERPGISCYLSNIARNSSQLVQRSCRHMESMWGRK